MDSSTGANYNQTVKVIKANFPEKRALILLRQLESELFEFVKINKQVIDLMEEFDQRHMPGRTPSSR